MNEVKGGSDDDISPEDLQRMLNEQLGGASDRAQYDLSRLRTAAAEDQAAGTHLRVSEELSRFRRDVDAQKAELGEPPVDWESPEMRKFLTDLRHLGLEGVLFTEE